MLETWKMNGVDKKRKDRDENGQKLFGEFPETTKEEWKEQILKDLRGQDFEKLNWKPYEGFTVNPFYTAQDVEHFDYLANSTASKNPFIKNTETKDNDWKVSVAISKGDIKLANEAAKKSLRAGADSLTFICEINGNVISGVPIQNKNEFAELLADIPIGKIPIHFRCGSTCSMGILSLFINEAKERSIDANNLTGSLDTDPLRTLELNGSFDSSESDVFSELASLMLYLSDNMPKFKGLKIHGNQFHESGASITQELAFAMSSGAEYLDKLTSRGLTVDQISKHTSLSFSIGSNYFMEIAKLRAARLLWRNIIGAFKPKDEASKETSIETETCLWNKTSYDPHVNLLRGTVEAMAASIGGSDFITVLPLDSTFKPPDDFSSRIAINTHLILKNEAYLDRVIDASSGSYYIETLTYLLACKSWSLFQEIEKLGGMMEALRLGFIQNEIEKVRLDREANVATRKETLLGANQYPNLKEKLNGSIGSPQKSERLKKSGKKITPSNRNSMEFLLNFLYKDSSHIGDIAPRSQKKRGVKLKTLQPYRGAEEFEDMRLASEIHAEESGKSPAVFLLPIGSLAIRTARASFSANFFGCAGFNVIENAGFDSPDQGVDAALESGSKIVVICGSDEDYRQVAPAISKKLKAKNPQARVVIAGNPRDHIRELTESGINDFIHIRSNALQQLRDYQKHCGIQGR